MKKKSRSVHFFVYLFGVFLLFSAFFTPGSVHALLPGETVSDTSSYSYALGYWDGAYYVGVAVNVNGSSCAANYGTIYSPGFSSQGYGPSSISTTCSVTAGPPGTTYSFTKYYNALGSGWVSSSGGSYTVSAPTCTSFTYSGWGACGPSGWQSRTVLSSSPSGCTGGSPVTDQTCTYVPPSCTYTYSDWGTCQSNGTQTRTVTSSSPSGCSGSPTTSQSCTYTPPSCSYTYSSWGECQSNSTQTRTVTSSSPSGCSGNPTTSQSCTYIPPTYTVSTSASPSYGGSVSCSGCTGVSSNTATLSASPYSGYQISGWSIGSCGTSSSCSTQTDSYKTVTVYFTQTPPAFYLSNFNVCDASSGGNCGSTVYGNGTGYYKVRVANSGGSGGTFNGHITINGGNWVGISSYISSGSYADFAPGVSSGTGTYTFGACQDNLVGCTGGTAVTFIAKPSLSGPSSVSSGGSATFTVSYDGAKTPTYSSYSCGTGGSFVSSSGATFTCSYVNNGGSAITASPSVAVSQGGISTTVSTSVTVNPVFYLSVSKSGSGTVTGTGISCGGTCATYLTQGTSVSLSASPSSGYVFGNWSGDCSGSGSCALTMNGARSVTANFTRVYSISASASSGGTVSCSGCGGSVSPGASVTVTATPSGGYYTSGWSGLGSGCSGNSCSITASADGSIGATFSAVTVSGTLSPSNTSAMTGQTSTFTPSRTGGTASGAVTFSGQSCGGGTISNINASTGAFTCGYSTSGTFTPSATVSQQGVSATPTASITISPFTDSFTITSPANGTTYNSGQTFTVSGTISTYYKGYQVRATLPSSEGLAQGTTPTSPQAFAFTTAPLTVPGTAGTYTVTVAVALDYLPGFGWGGNVKFLPSQTFTINVAAPASPQTVPKPRVSFSITPTAQCGTAKQADILKGATAGLCWKAVPDPIGTYCGTWDGKSVYIGRLWKQEGNTSYYVGTSGAAADTMSCVGLWDNTNNSWSQSMFCKYADQRQCSFSTSALGGTAYSSSPGSFPACPSGWHASGDGCGPDSASVGGGGGDVPSAIVQSVSCQPASGSSSGGFQGSLASNGSASSAALNVDRQFSIECWGKDGSGTKVTDIATDSVTAKVVGPDLTATTPTVQLLFGTTPPSGTTNTFYAGSSIKLTSTVTNGGTAGTGVAFKGSWQAYPSATTPTSVSQYTTLTNGLKDITALGTGGSQISTHTITGVTEGTFYLGFCPDSSGVVNELSETNNCSAPVTVVIKKLYIPNVSLYVSKDSTCGTGATAQTIAGTKVTLCWKVNAQ